MKIRRNLEKAKHRLRHQNLRSICLLVHADLIEKCIKEIEACREAPWSLEFPSSNSGSV